MPGAARTYPRSQDCPYRSLMRIPFFYIIRSPFIYLKGLPITNDNSFARPSPVTGSSNNDGDKPLIDKRSIQDLIKEVDPQSLLQIDDEVEEMLIQIAEEFVETTILSSCQNAKHRKSNIVEAKDVQLYLERTHNMWIPGFGIEDSKSYKKFLTNDALKASLKSVYLSNTNSTNSSTKTSKDTQQGSSNKKRTITTSDTVG
ncbi:unnamed protein product [Didymodactylos carnosus]|uniref:Transcription initiation factor TFIID subunit 12 n=1 Tax=Didymodactylos carnosus TaxID=1234261 RepID=A0A813QAA9_9BILA|nr:unnamed protein product [Didymodactylos carnosus]CAF0843056.1 unnamed protein product [Didymodactylos carnosus]CAF3545400.1 unnamed protein product [Didymodactylos carnosus]CAF3628074.1 unnamed protein product [Didymodactylos carnosus]